LTTFTKTKQQEQEKKIPVGGKKNWQTVLKHWLTAYGETEKAAIFIRKGLCQQFRVLERGIRKKTLPGKDRAPEKGKRRPVQIRGGTETSALGGVESRRRKLEGTATSTKPEEGFLTGFFLRKTDLKDYQGKGAHRKMREKRASLRGRKKRNRLDPPRHLTEPG